MAWSRAVGRRGGWGQTQRPGFPLGRVSPQGDFQGELVGLGVHTLTCWLALLTHCPRLGDARSQVTRAQDVAL